MSDAATTSGAQVDSDRGVSPASLTPEAVEAILADFRSWLLEAPLAADERPESAAPSVDLFTLVSQFTALRHEVNMQTRAVRAAMEQNAEALALLQAAEPEDAAAEQLRPTVKALVDIADALRLSMRQMERFQETAQPLLESLGSAQPSGFFSRLFGSRPAPVDPGREPVLGKLAQLTAAAADGYRLSLRRVESALESLDLEQLSCLGEPFDPETMEAVELVGDSEHGSGAVAEEVRPGYLWRGRVFRFAQVRVAR